MEVTKNIREINEFTRNGRRYCVYEILKRYCGDIHTHYVVMFDTHGQHSIYVDKKDITPDRIEGVFRKIGLIEPDFTDRMSADTFRAAIQMLNDACYEDGTGVDETDVEYAIKYHKLK